MTFAELAAQLAQNQGIAMAGNVNAGQDAPAARPLIMPAAQEEDRVAPISYDDWKQGSYGGKELSGMGKSRDYYNNWANKYYDAGTAGRNDLLKSHGLQFEGNAYSPGWGWMADEGIEQRAAGMSPWMAIRNGAGGLGYGEANFGPDGSYGQSLNDMARMGNRIDNAIAGYRDGGWRGGLDGFADESSDVGDDAGQSAPGREW